MNSRKFAALSLTLALLNTLFVYDGKTFAAEKKSAGAAKSSSKPAGGGKKPAGGGKKPSARESASSDDSDGKDADSGTDKKSSEKAKSDDDDKPKVTEHTVTIGGNKIKYKATAGYMVLKDFENHVKKHGDDDKDKSDKDKKKEDHKPRARVFYIAYTREDAGAVEKRPVTFSFNGGPGSASVWLHMGAMGPRRCALTDRGEALPPPYKLEDNEYSWLDGTDLVFIDPVSTGFSRTVKDEDPKKFHGYKEDIESVGDFIRLYITKNKRWSSPKFIVGESYGTTRAAGLSDFLQDRYGIYLNGIVLVSAVLNFATIDFSPNNDLPYVLFLPSFAATAWYHKRLPDQWQSKSLNELLGAVENFVASEYLVSLFKGDKLDGPTRRNVAEKVASFTGLPSGYVDQLNLRVSDQLFFNHLLMDKNKRIGRFDSRYTGIRYYPGTESDDFDPSFEAVTGPFNATFNDYVSRELKFESELPYETLANVWPWSFKNAQNRYLNVSEDLRKAMSRNPYLKVWIASGYYDLATPYFASKYTVDQMSLDPAIKGNVTMTYYDAGHMMYANKPDLKKLKSDFDSYLAKSVLPASAAVPAAAP